MVEQLGTIFLKPSEKGQVSQKTAESGIIYSIPETGEQYDPATGKFVQVTAAASTPQQYVQQQVDKHDRKRSYYSIEETRKRELAAWERGRPARELAARIKAEAEAKARAEAERREAARREAERQRRIAEISGAKRKGLGERAVTFALVSPAVPIFSIATPRGVAGTTKGPTIREIKRAAREFGPVPAGIFGVVPETRVGLVGTTAAAGLYPILPKLIQIGVSGTIAGTQAPKVFDPTLPTEQRITAGIIGTGAAVGTVAEVIPFARGLKAQTLGRVTRKFKPTKLQPEGFKAIQLKETRVGIIPEKAPLKIGITKEVKLPKISPLKRGGFGVTPSQKKLFLGKQTVATSQRGLFKKGKIITPKPEAPREFYVSPRDPFAKIPVTRESRLGLVDLFKPPKQAQVGFGVPKKPQVGIEFGAKVGRVEKGGAYRIGTGTELEAIKTLPIIKVGKRLGVTTIKGQAIDIFQIKTTPTKGIGKITPPKVSTFPSARVSGEAAITTALTTKSFLPKITTIPTISRELPPVSLPPPTYVSPPTKVISYVTPPRRRGRPSISPPTRVPTRITPPVSPPVSPPISPPISPPTRIPIRITPPTISPPSPPISPSTKLPPYRPPVRLKPRREPRRRQPTYGVHVRRFGKFRPIAKGVTFAQAVEIGRGRVGRTLAATFKLTPKYGKAARGLRTPKGFYAKPTKKGVEFIERRGLRLSTRPEIKEIQFYQKKKKKKRK